MSLTKLSLQVQAFVYTLASASVSSLVPRHGESDAETVIKDIPGLTRPLGPRSFTLTFHESLWDIFSRLFTPLFRTRRHAEPSGALLLRPQLHVTVGGKTVDTIHVKCEGGSLRGDVC